MNRMARKLGFTLMEVNLAIFIMAAGVLAMVALYPLGYRESEQSREDVTSAIIADAVLNQIAAALSSRDIKWNDWKSAVESAINVTGESQRTGGWMGYCRTQGSGFRPLGKDELNRKARDVFSKLTRAYKGVGSSSWPVTGSGRSVPACALVAQWGRTPVVTQAPSGSKPAVIQQHKDRSRVAISFRCSGSAGSLFAAPIYYTEIHFQGEQENLQ